MQELKLSQAKAGKQPIDESAGNALNPPLLPDLIFEDTTKIVAGVNDEDLDGIDFDLDSDLVSEDATEGVVCDDPILLVESAPENSIKSLDILSDFALVKPTTGYIVHTDDFSIVSGLNKREIVGWNEASGLENLFGVLCNTLSSCLPTVCENASMIVPSVFMKNIAIVLSWCGIKPFQGAASSLNPPKKPPDYILKALEALKQFGFTDLSYMILIWVCKSVEDSWKNTSKHVIAKVSVYYSEQLTQDNHTDKGIAREFLCANYIQDMIYYCSNHCNGDIIALATLFRCCLQSKTLSRIIDSLVVSGRCYNDRSLSETFIQKWLSRSDISVDNLLVGGKLLCSSYINDSDTYMLPRKFIVDTRIRLVSGNTFEDEVDFTEGSYDKDSFLRADIHLDLYSHAIMVAVAAPSLQLIKHLTSASNLRPSNDVRKLLICVQKPPPRPPDIISRQLDEGTMLRAAERLSCGNDKSKFDVDYHGDHWGGDRFWNYITTFLQSVDKALKVQTAIKNASIAPNFYPAALYQTAIVGSGTPSKPELEYSWDVDPNKNYSVWLHFAEIDESINGVGQRVFDILINGDIAFPNVDIVKLTGGLYAAMVLNTTVAVSGRALVITIQPTKGNAIINALEVFEIINAESKTVVDEVRGLQSIKKALALPSHFGWNGDPCVPQQHPWTGADCQPDRTLNRWVIDGLDLDSQGLRGFLPNDISKLRHLQSLNLGGNSIGGRIPSSIGNITSLEILNLSYNSFNGSIPESLGQLLNLKKLYLNGNSLSGRVPASVGGMLLHGASFKIDYLLSPLAWPLMEEIDPHSSGVILGKVAAYGGAVQGMIMSVESPSAFIEDKTINQKNKFINHISMYSLPRPPEFANLEDKVDFKGVGMIRAWM